MPNALNGFITAVVGVLDGTILYYVLKGFVDSGLLDSAWLIVYAVANIAAIATFVHSTRYWGTLYLFSWWLGFGIMLYSGLVEPLEFIIYSVVLSLVLVTRFRRHFEE